MVYVDGYVLAVPKKKLSAYKKIAKEAGKIWMKHGALQVLECVEDDLKTVCGSIPFQKVVKSKADDLVFYSFIIYKSKSDRNRINKKVGIEMKEEWKDLDMPFKMNQMVFGGFKSVVEF